ncbi:hypothetical protein D3C87_40380 [compost metagenome]
MSYPSLNLPSAQLKLSKEKEEFFVWCVIRRKKLLLTPEEWVRQHVIHYLIYHKGTAIERINSEHLLKINGQNRRCDVVVVDSLGNAKLIIECKAPEISLDEKVFLQTSNYIQKSKAAYFWMTNGLNHVMVECEKPEIYLDDLPEL